MIDNRINRRNEAPDNPKGKYVLYWMQGAQRIDNNHALYIAMKHANLLGLPLLVGFVLMPSYPHAVTGHYRFMLEGLSLLQKELKQMGINWVMTLGDPVQIVAKWAEEAALIVMDKGYTRFPRHMRDVLAKRLHVSLYEVDTNLIIPVEKAYPKEAYAAYAIRPHLMKLASEYASTVVLPKVQNDTQLCFEEGVEGTADMILSKHLTGLRSHEYTHAPRGGEIYAQKALDYFIAEHLKAYEGSSNHPNKSVVSRLSPYLHFGQISPVTIYERVLASGLPCAAFIEQLVVRRELAYNFVWYNKEYDQLERVMPDWAKESFERHSHDERPAVYSLNTLEEAGTYDAYWNAAQNELLQKGTIHNYMRMYWGKKIIEWSSNPQEAFDNMIYLNDTYAIDGRDPNGYAGIAWCSGKHDRPFFERKVFGKVRYMNAEGLKRKFKMEEYTWSY